MACSTSTSSPKDQESQALANRKRLILLAEIILILTAFIVHLVIQEKHLTGFGFKALDDLLKFIAVTILVSFLYRGTMKKLDDEARKKDLSELLDQKIDRMIKNHVHHGLDSFTDKLDYVALLNDLKTGDEMLWLDTYPPTSRDFHGALKAAAERGVTIKMLLLQPDCPNAKNRALELSATCRSERLIREAAECMIDLNDLSNQVNQKHGGSGKLEVRWYDGLPSVAAYIVCRNTYPVKAYTSFLLSEPTDVNFPHMLWVRGRDEDRGNFLDHFHKYFLNKWAATASDNTEPAPSALVEKMRDTVKQA